MTRPNPSEHIRVTRPDDWPSVDPDDQFVSVDQDGIFHSGGHTVNSQGGEQKSILFRPQVTVNVFNGGGSKDGGSGGGGHGRDGAATVNNSNGYSSGDTISSLVYQVAALSKKVEQLSSLASVQGPVIENGMWHTNNVRSWERPQLRTEGRVNFSKEFKSVPTVVASLKEADVYKGANFRVKVYVTDIDLKGFTAHADGWADTQIYSCGISWIAIGN